MAYTDWKDRVEGFKEIDVRGVAGNFFQGLKKQAAELKQGEGITIIQSFEPIPLYRAVVKKQDKDIPMRPVALTNMPIIDENLGKISVEFWDLTWNDSKRYLPYETRLLLSLTNAVGAGRMRQATRELVKSYISGLDSAALDDVFELLVWNQGIGYFSSEIGPSTLFAAYKTIKQMEKQGKDRSEIVDTLKEKFDEKNPDIKVV